MSRIGKLAIAVPAGVDVTIDGQHVTVKGKKWTLAMTIVPACVATLTEWSIIVSLVDSEQKNMRWLTRTLIANMVQWVTEWYEVKLHVIGIGYNVKIQWQEIHLSLGLSHPVVHVLPASVQAVSEKDPKWNDILTLTSIDKQRVGQEAAKIKAYRQPEPYKGKGIRYFGQVIKLKAGKTGGKK